MRLFYSRGFSLLEVLIAIFILSFGLMGIVGLYIHSFKRVENSFWQTLAISQLISMKEEFPVSKKNCPVFNERCRNLLPNGECKCNLNLVKICWGKMQDKQCLEL